MVSNNEVMQTMGDLQTGYQNHDLSKFIQDMQQERTQHPQETQQYLAACNKVLEDSQVLPGMQLEGLNKVGDRAILKMPNGSEVTVGKNMDTKPLQPGEKPDATAAESKPAAADGKASTTDDTRPAAAAGADKPTTATKDDSSKGDSTYEIKKGDNLWRIAQHQLGADASPSDVLKYVKATAKANDMDNINQTIYPGQKLTLPGDRNTAAAAAKPARAPEQAKPADQTPPPVPQQKAAPIERVPPPQQPAQRQPAEVQPQQAPPGRVPSDMPQQQLPPGRLPSDRTPPFIGRGGDALPGAGDMQAQAATMARRAAVKVLNEHMDDLFKVAAALPIDGKIPVGMLTGMLGNNIDSKTLSMLQNVQSIEKHGNHIEITSNSDMRFAMGVNDKGAMLDDIKVGHKLSFDMTQDANGHNEFANVKGISVEGHAQGLGWHDKSFSADLENVTITKDASGHTAFNAEVKNPEKWYAKLGERLFKGVNRGEHITASIHLGDDGTVAVSDPNTNIKHRIA